MIELAVVNTDGKEVESLSIDEAVLGGEVRYALLKQAIVRWQANKRQGTAGTKSRGMVAGVNKKLFRQKGTGNARVGAKRTNKRVGGGVAFGRKTRDFTQRMPKKQRRLARDSAVLAKLQSEKVIVIDQLAVEAPKTKTFAHMLQKLGVERSCLVTTQERDVNVYKSARNIPRVEVLPLDELNAGQICNHEKMLITKDAMVAFMNRPANPDA